MAVDWAEHAKHRQQVAEDEGVWIGLADENCEPIMDAPPALSISAPRVRNAVGELRVEFSLQSPAGTVHPIVDEIIAEDLGVVDNGELVPSNAPTRFVLVQRAGAQVRAYRVTHARARGPFDAPRVLEVHGVDGVHMLERFPAITGPTTWQNSFTRFTRDWAGPSNVGVTFSKPRELAGMKMATVADGVTVEGTAESAVRELIRSSLAACWRVAGVDPAEAPLVVSHYSTDKKSPKALIRRSDEKLLDTILPVSAAAGLEIQVWLWLPGDKQPTGLFLTRPAFVIDLVQQEVSNAGAR
ncbi:hypothetical protein [Corynebacterium pseudodiphtheriticum]|uniref:hypothetical protein n=1 Tax=Corynebacterium pseudodiphtheriticum TaxID=37637 RepID=UPI00234D9088|nr:hypothetical protein [Corynebacterium pseudodiphtheriticum]MDC7087855.1 hypothetical protein [Corynebacterium pseudodiphtheriticum]